MITLSFTSDKSNWEKLKVALTEGDKKELVIGFFREDRYGPENKNLPVALVAAWQDKGTPFVGPTHIPARPFMSQGLKNLLKSPLYTAKYKKAFMNILDNETSFVDEYKKISIAVVPALKDIIDKWSYPPNAALTIAEKGRNDPLVDTGKMRDSVKAKIRNSK